MKNFFLIILLSFSCILSWAQENTVSLKGKVIDATDGYPLIGVAVVASGTDNGVITDVDGTYEITIPKQKTEIVFSYMGYDDVLKIYNTNNASAFSKIVMTMNAQQLADVVVTGIYERKKESFTGASATFKADELKVVGTSSVLQSLKTLVP